MLISLENIIETPDEQYYSHIIENYGEEGLFDPVEISKKMSDNSVNSIFKWLEWLDWRVQNIDYEKWNTEISNFINTHFNKCSDLEILYWLLLIKPNTQVNVNFQYYIKLYEKDYIETDFQKPFDLWICLFNLHSHYWSEYFLARKYVVSTDTDYPNSLIAELIPRLINQKIKNKWIEKFFSNTPNSRDFLSLLINDDSFNTPKWFQYFKELNPSSFQICLLILRKAEQSNIFTSPEDSKDLFWFNYYKARKGDLFLLIYTMNRVLSGTANHCYNLKHWVEFLTFIESDFNIIEIKVRESENTILQKKWANVKI